MSISFMCASSRVLFSLGRDPKGRGRFQVHSTTGPFGDAPQWRADLGGLLIRFFVEPRR